ncbi:MAG: vitamin K epoxide reductase family protein [Thermoleophilia bacterium]
MGLSLVSVAALAVVEAYQVGIVRRVPEPPWRWLAADRVDASGEAYALLRTPDAGLGILSEAVSIVLVGMGGADRAGSRPWVPLAAAVKTLADAAGAAWLFAEQVTRHRRLCGWCTLAAAADVARVPLVLPEARRAWHVLRGG